ncbi:MAG: PspC domain-containing protein [Propionibacteriaceae bacterium]|nr:PspC domain-containing protein [Propionibacteriaceae bacterium]
MTDRLPVLSRPREGAVIAGVCAGLARRLGVEPKVLRIIAVVSAIAFGGLGAALYLAGMLLLPRDNEQLSPLARTLPFTRRWPRWVVVAGVIALLVLINWGSGAGPAFVPLTIIGVVVWAATRKHGRPTSAAEPTPFERAADAWRVRLAEQQVPGFELPAGGVPGPSAPGPGPSTGQPTWQQPYTDPSDRFVSDNPLPVALAPAPRRSWRLWGLGLALVGAFTLAVAVASTFFGLPGTPVAYASAVLAALGTTALVATRAGRPPLLVPATVIAALVLGGLVASPQIHSQGTVGDVSARYTSAAQLPPRIDVLAGDADVDLSRLTLTGTHELAIHVRAGDVRLTLPQSVASSVDWDVSAGSVTVGGVKQSGSGLGQTGGMAHTPNPSTGEVRITVDVDLGDLEVNP